MANHRKSPGSRDNTPREGGGDAAGDIIGCHKDNTWSHWLSWWMLTRILRSLYPSSNIYRSRSKERDGWFHSTVSDVIDNNWILIYVWLGYLRDIRNDWGMDIVLMFYLSVWRDDSGQKRGHTWHMYLIDSICMAALGDGVQLRSPFCLCGSKRY